MIRANQQETVRAPAVTELYRPRGQVSAFITDPCDAENLDLGPNPEIRRANCAAEGIPTDFVSAGQRASRLGFSGGNTDLRNEVASTENIGLTYTPSLLEGFAVTADYVSIELEDAIISMTPSAIAEACYDATDYPNAFCNRLNRGSDGQFPIVNAFESGYGNAALRNFEALEYTVSYAANINDMPLIGNLIGNTDFGPLSTQLRFFNLLKDETSNTGADFTDETGQYDKPKWRSSLRMTHNYNNLTALLDVDYTSEGKRNVENNNPLTYLDEKGNPFTMIDSRMLVNLGFVYDLTESTSVRLNLENVTDWKPSPIESSIGRWTYGRSYTLGVSARF